MIHSTNQELGEFETCREPQHIARVWKAIEGRLPGYWDRFVEREAAKAAGQKRLSAEAALKAFASAIQQYEKQAAKYRDFFDVEAMDEFAEDPGVFKQHLAKDVPVIAGSLNQRRPELQEWQRHYRASRSRDLYEVFANILDFQRDWAKNQKEAVYATYNSPEDIGLEPLDGEEMGLVSVIGMGIKSIVLYNLDPQKLPQRARTDLYGLYFLSGMDDFGLASKSSEFLMINDREVASNGSMVMEHNFWYSYELFTLYALRIFRWLQEKVTAEGASLDTAMRYVYVTHFLSQVCSEHIEDMKIMRAHDRFEVPK